MSAQPQPCASKRVDHLRAAQRPVRPPTAASRRGTYCLYMVRCADGTYYAGSTNHLALRLQRHNAGTGAKYLRGRAPVRVVYVRRCRDKVRALQAEWRLKQLTRAQKERLLERAACATQRLLGVALERLETMSREASHIVSPSDPLSTRERSP